MKRKFLKKFLIAKQFDLNISEYFIKIPCYEKAFAYHFHYVSCMLMLSCRHTRVMEIMKRMEKTHMKYSTL